ncbi:MAG: c-type cytochrome [Hyphomicrobium sp.]|nr:c-type cytochrome [Hyphomicrobium sp.]
MDRKPVAYFAGLAQAIVGPLVVLAFLATSTLPVAADSKAWQENIAEGKQEYDENCVSCHGADGKGRGDLGQKLFKKPSDLTTISERNEGEFPFERVFRIIAGDTQVEGHETMHMPEYAARMKRDNFKPGYHQAHIRILQLTHYLESIQAK